jgi:hypothetical protein
VARVVEELGERGENLQGIPTVDTFPVNLFEFLAAITILIVLVSVIGIRKQKTKPKYWVVAIFEVAIFAVLWLILAIMINAIVFTHFNLAVEIKPIVVDILNIGLYLGFCALILVIEKYRGLHKIQSETTEVINE